MDDSKLSDRTFVAENNSPSQSASSERITMTPITNTRTHWARFYADLDTAQCRGDLEKAVFRYCAERPDVPISFAEIIMALGDAHVGLDVMKIQNIAGKFARKFQNGKHGFTAHYHETHQTLTYVAVVTKPRALDLKKGRAEVDLILRTNPCFRAAPSSHRERDVHIQDLVDLLGESSQQVRRMIRSGELDWLLGDELDSDSSKT